MARLVVQKLDGTNVCVCHYDGDEPQAEAAKFGYPNTVGECYGYDAKWGHYTMVWEQGTPTP